MDCVGCNTHIPEGKNSCPMCGATIEKIRHDLGLPEEEPKQKHSDSAPYSNTTIPKTKICKHCKMIVNKDASICPYCRKKLTTSIISMVFTGFFAVIVGSCVVGTYRNQSAPPPPPPTAAQIEQSKESQLGSDAKWSAKLAVESTLKAPSTAKWPNYNDFTATRSKEFTNTWDVRGYVDAQNTFGTMTRTNFTVKVYNSGNGWKLIDIKTQ